VQVPQLMEVFTPEDVTAAGPRGVHLGAKLPGFAHRDDVMINDAAKHTQVPTGTSTEGATAADLPARARQAGVVMCQRRRRSRSLSAAVDRTRADRQGTPDGGASPQRGTVPVGENPRQLDFLALPSLNETLVLGLGRSDYVLRRDVIAVGNGSIGKTQVSTAMPGLMPRGRR
jgi:hypothetical protein